jgi:hypothetical protein
MKPSERIKPLTEFAERIKTDQKIPGRLKGKLLPINRFFIRELKKYDQALEVLRDSKNLLERANKGEITREQYDAVTRHARQGKEECERFTQILSELVSERG